MEATQGSALPIYTSDTSLTLQDLFTLETISFQADWFGKPPEAKTSFIFAEDPESVMLGALCLQPPAYDTSFQLGNFAEGLWKHHVAEFFLKEDGSSRYQEFNLSPSGAWWSGVFSEYRVEDKEGFKKPDGVETLSEIETTQWKAAISVPKSSLSIRAALGKESQANVAFIIGKKERQFLSWSKIRGEKPDFHRAEDFSLLTPQEK